MTYHTAERMGWSRWTRKRRRKFKKRYFKQHGHRFMWFVSEFRFVSNPEWETAKPIMFIFHEAHPSVGLGSSIKPG